MTGEESFDGRFQVRNALEDAAADRFLAELPKPAFDQIGPRGAGWSKVELETRMLFEPMLHFGVFVGAVVIQDQVESERLGVTRIQGAQEL